MLRTKEIQDEIQREADKRNLEDRINNKLSIQNQIVQRKQLEEEARNEYLKEKEQVDNVIQRMINEDREMARI